MVSFADLELREGIPIYLQIVRHLKAAIAAGTVQDGEEMPSRRVLSALLGVNPNTIQKAYRQLEDEGLIRSHAGAKSFVSAGAARTEALRQELPEWSAASFVEEMRRLGVTREAALELVRRLWDRDREGQP